LVYAYSARPDEFVSQMPWLPDNVFRASVDPEAAEPEPAGLGAAEAGVDGGRLVLVAPPAAPVLLLDPLLQAAATIATAANVRPRPALRTEVLQSMKILLSESGPTDGPHVMAHFLLIRNRCRKGLKRLETKSPPHCVRCPYDNIYDQFSTLAGAGGCATGARSQREELAQ
jgi:hypothetical protein